MNDQFAGGTPWDDAPVASRPPASNPGEKFADGGTPWDKPELSQTAKAKAPRGPIFQGYGQKTKKMKVPKVPKKTVDTDDVPFETAARYTWKIIRILRTVTIVAFVISLAIFTYAFAVSSSGNPLELTTHTALLGIPAGPHVLTPFLANIIVLLLSILIAGIVAVNLAKPHGRFRQFTYRAWIFAAAAIIVDPFLAVILWDVLQTMLHAVAGHLPPKFGWVLDANALPPVKVPSAIVSPTPTPIPAS